MAGVKKGLYLALCFFLVGCMSLHLPRTSSSIPVSLTQKIYGYRVIKPVKHFSKEIWTYHLLGLPQVPIGTREGYAIEDILDEVLMSQTKPGQGVIRLKIRHQRSFFTWMTTIFSLGLLSPTAVSFEGEVVELERVSVPYSAQAESPKNP